MKLLPANQVRINDKIELRTGRVLQVKNIYRLDRKLTIDDENDSIEIWEEDAVFLLNRPAMEWKPLSIEEYATVP
jgi:hypothetical protein